MDVIVPLGVDLVDHGRERGRLARTRRSGHQHQSARLIAKFADHRRQSQLVERLDFERDDAEDGRRRAALVETVRAEAGQALQAERKVEFEILFETMLLRIGHYAVGELLGFRRRQLRQIERNQVSVDTHLRR
jgi:hypothetical protein